MTCRCSEFGPLELKRARLNKRTRDSKAIKASLELVARDAEGYASLWKCASCGQMWQSGFTSSWYGSEYFFQVPPTALEDWEREPFAAPVALLDFAMRIQEFVDSNRGQETEAPCGSPACARRAMRLSKFCLAHHIEMMQRAHLLPSMPHGRLLEPYEWIASLPKYLDEVS